MSFLSLGSRDYGAEGNDPNVKMSRVSLLLVLLVVLAVGCGGPKAQQPKGQHSVVGMVTEVGTAVGSAPEVPLEGVKVTVDSKTVTTGSDGLFEITNVKSGPQTIKFGLNGYEGRTENVSVEGETVVDVALSPRGGRAAVGGESARVLDDLDGTETDDTVVTLRGNTSDFEFSEVSGSGTSGLAEIRPFTTAITVAQLEALVNGTVYVIDIDGSGNFEQEVPIDPGSNTIQLRVFSTEGDAYTTEPIVVTVTFDRLDLRVVLRWDTTGWSDVDLHMFKRNPGEGNPAGDKENFFDSSEWWGDDRHVYWDNPVPDDFGETTAQNPFLDIDDTDGYGPETIVLQEATNGQYHIWVHFYNKPSDPETEATIDVTLRKPGTNEPVTRRFTKTLTEDWEFWYVTTVSWPQGTFINVAPTATSGSATRSTDAVPVKK